MNDLERSRAFVFWVREQKGARAWTYLAQHIDIDRSWFPRFYRGHIKNPRYDAIRAVLDFASSIGWSPGTNQKLVEKIVLETF